MPLPGMMFCSMSVLRTASIATDKIGDYEYLVIIFVQKAKASATN